MTNLSQQDSRWVGYKYSNGYTLGKSGCLITDITMFYNWAFNRNERPDVLSKKLGFTPDGLLLWNSISNIGLKFLYRYYSRNDAVISEAISNPNKGCLLQVNSNHWLLATGRKLPILGYKVADPWSGTSCYTNKYGNNITGFATITR